MATMLDAVINLKDNFSSTLKQVEKNIGGFSRTAKNMGKDIQRVGKNLESMGSKLTASVTVPIIAGIGASINEFAKLQQSIGGIETLFKGSASNVIANSETAYKRAGVSANAYMENITSFSASLLQGLGGDTEKAAKIADMAMVDMSDNANKFGTDIIAIQNAYQGFAKDNFTMLDNLKLGYGGTAGEMARLINDTGVMGVKFKATAKNVKDIPFDKMIEAINKVQDEMGITGTTTKEAMETVSGSIGMAKASLQDFLGGLGNSDADVGQLTKNMVESFKVVVKNIKEVLGTMWDNIPLDNWQKKIITFAIAAGPLMLVLGKITSGIGGLAIKFGEFAGKVKKLGLIKAIFTPGVLVVGVILALAAAGYLLYKNWDKIKDIVIKVKDAIMDFTGITGDHMNYIKDVFIKFGTIVWENILKVIDTFKPLGKTIQDLFGRLGEVLQGILPIILPILAFLGGVFVTKFIWVFQTILLKVMAVVEGIVGVIDGLLNVFSGLLEFIIGVFTRDWSRAWEGLQLMFSGVIDIISSIWGAFIGFITAPVQAAVDIFDSLFHDKLGGIKKAWEGMKEFFKHPIKGTINLAKKGAAWVNDNVGNNYNGTNNWKGGPTWVHEKGAEIIDLPGGSRVYPHDKSVSMAREQGRMDGQGKGGILITGNTFNVRKESDIDSIANAIVRKLEQAKFNTA